MSLSLSGEGIEYLDSGQIQATLAYRYLYADTGYWGNDRRADLYRSGPGARLTLHSFDLNLTYGLTRRFSLSLITPFIFGSSPPSPTTTADATRTIRAASATSA